jgi:hypothetical protein
LNAINHCLWERTTCNISTFCTNPKRAITKIDKIIKFVQAFSFSKCSEIIELGKKVKCIFVEMKHIIIKFCIHFSYYIFCVHFVTAANFENVNGK